MGVIIWQVRCGLGFEMSMMSYKRTKAYSAEKGSIVKILSFECLFLSSIATVLLTILEE